MSNIARNGYVVWEPLRVQRAILELPFVRLTVAAPEDGDAGSRLPAVRDDVQAIRGVLSAAVRWPQPGEPAILRILLSPRLGAAQRGRVTRQVLEVLAEVGGVDLGSLQVGPTREAPTEPALALEPPTPGPVHPQVTESTAAGREHRPRFAGLTVDRHFPDVEAFVELVLGSLRLEGHARMPATATAELRVVATATLEALRPVVEAAVRLELDGARLITGNEWPVAECTITVLTGHGEEAYLGTALVRGDVAQATARATLDALNRPLQLLARGAAA
jgi:hypothetical protein